jgi:NTE family protein
VLDASLILNTTDTKIAKNPLADRMNCRNEFVEPFAMICTRLNPLSVEEQGRLINWGYALCDATLRSHAAALAPNAARPGAWPVPSQPLGTL